MFTTSDNYGFKIMQAGANDIPQKATIPTNQLAKLIVKTAKKRLNTVIYLQAIGSQTVWKVTLQRFSASAIGYDIVLYDNTEVFAQATYNNIAFVAVTDAKKVQFAAYLLAGILSELK